MSQLLESRLALVVYAIVTASAVSYSPPVSAQAHSLPPGVLACAQEPDSLKRLVCYDREVGKYRDAAPDTAGNPPGHEPLSGPSGGHAPAPVAAASSTAPQPKHISARIVRIENFPDALVVHLDNDQVWQQVQEATAAVNLRVGDTVSIDRELLSYWMSGADGTAFKVKRKQ